MSKEPRKYYDFSYLLDANIKHSSEDTKRILTQSGTSLNEMKSIMQKSILGAMEVHSDLLYKRIRNNKIIMTESIIDTIAAALNRMDVEATAAYVRDTIKKLPETSKFYVKLLDFEIDMIKRKNERLTASK